MARNSRVLVIGDLHLPYQHPDAFKYLRALKETHKPDRVISIGDETDYHAISYHESAPELFSAGHELQEARRHIERLANLFKKMDILESNHGSLYFRKAKTLGIPRHLLGSQRQILKAPSSWRWHYELTITLSDKSKVYLHHGKTSQVLKLSQSMGMSAIQGHYHEKMSIEYWANPTGLYWAAQTGCLIDDKSMAFEYNNVNLKRPLLGSLMIINGQPRLVPMILDKKNKWIGRLV